MGPVCTNMVVMHGNTILTSSIHNAITIDMYVCTLCRGMVRESVCKNCAFLGDMVAAHTCCGASYSNSS